MLPFKIFPGMLASAKIFYTASCATVDVATPLPHATTICFILRPSFLKTFISFVYWLF